MRRRKVWRRPSEADEASSHSLSSPGETPERSWVSAPLSRGGGRNRPLGVIRRRLQGELDVPQSFPLRPQRPNGHDWRFALQMQGRKHDNLA